MNSQQGSKKDKKSLIVTLLVMAVVSDYFVPPTEEIHQGIFNWLIYQQQYVLVTEGLYRIIRRITLNFQVMFIRLYEEEASLMEDKKSRENSMEHIFTHLYFPPPLVEIESILSGSPLVVSVYLTNGHSI
jgi:hypothetical protein